MKTPKPSEGISIQASDALLTDESSELGFQNFTALIRRRALVIGLTVAIVFFSIAFFTMIQMRVFEATTKLVVAPKSSGSGGGADDSILSSLASLRQGRTVETQVEIINSRDLLDTAFKKFDEKEQKEGFKSNTVLDRITPSNSTETEKQTAPLWSYDIKSRPDTDVITITARSYRKKLAADFANAIAQTYLDEDKRRNSQATSLAREYVEREKETSQTELSGATAKLQRFKEKTGLIAPEQQVSELAHIEVELQMSLDTARSDALAAEKQLANGRQRLRTLSPEIDFQKTIAENPEITLIRAQIVELQGKLTDLLTEFTKDSPEVTQARQQLEAENQALRRLSRTVVVRKTGRRLCRSNCRTHFGKGQSGLPSEPAHQHEAVPSQVSARRT